MLEYIEKLGGKLNRNIYEELFKSFNTKKAYQDWVEVYVRNDVLNLMVPQDNTVKISVENNLAVLEELGGDTFGPLRTTTLDGLIQETPISFFVVYMPSRIPSQTVAKGLAVSDSKTPNPMTGQVNTASKFTSPELGILYGLDLDLVLKEVVRARGGDEGLGEAMGISLLKEGSFSLLNMEKYAKGITSTETLDSYFRAIHIEVFPENKQV